MHGSDVRAVVLTEHGGPEVLRVADVEPPVAGPDEILVDVHHTAVNRADVLQRLGHYPDPRRDAAAARRSPVSSTPASSPPSATGSPSGSPATT